MTTSTTTLEEDEDYLFDAEPTSRGSFRASWSITW